MGKSRKTIHLELERKLYFLKINVKQSKFETIVCVYCVRMYVCTILYMYNNSEVQKEIEDLTSSWICAFIR